MGQQVILELTGDHQLARDLGAGGVFVPNCELALNEDVELIVRAGNAEVRVTARCVWAQNGGAGLQLLCDAETKQQIAELASKPAEPEAAPEDPPEQPPEEPADTSDTRAPNMHERLRHLSLAQQVKLAHTGEVSERIVLERMYGKNVWEALLRNPRVTGPEVARIARMGSLPKPLIEIIVGNGAWLQIPEVRRALLSNPRLGTDAVIRILRMLPKHELKLAPQQTAYPHVVRDAARRMIKEASGA